MQSNAASSLGLIDVNTDNAESLDKEYKEAKKNKNKPPKVPGLPDTGKAEKPKADTKLTGKQTAQLIAQQQKQEGNKKLAKKISLINRYQNHPRLGPEIAQGLGKCKDYSEAGVDARLNDIRNLFSEMHIEHATHQIVTATAGLVETATAQGKALEKLFGFPVNIAGYGNLVAQNQQVLQHEEDEMAVEMADFMGAPYYVRLLVKLGFMANGLNRLHTLSGQPISNLESTTPPNVGTAA